jgi:hypothetical protein
MSFDSDFRPEFTEGDIMSISSEGSYKDTFQILISDEFGGQEKGYAHGPERALMLAMLFDAVQAYICYSQLAPCKKTRSQYREAFNWVHDKSKDYIFSFNNICDALGINPNYLRLGLLNLMNSKIEHKRARRKF